MFGIQGYEKQIFDDYRRINEYEEEFWYARDLQTILDYEQWRNFLKVMDKAREACENSNQLVSDHFAEVSKMVGIGSGSTREIEDWMLSRYACYLIVQNADPRKEVVALGQTYFAVQTRKQELRENLQSVDEDKKRLAIRNELKVHNKSLAEAAKQAGVKVDKDYAIFQNHGYKGLYSGLGSQDIHERKGLRKNHKILDYMGSTELAANLFRATQTDEKLRRDNIQGKLKANQTHYDVGLKVRQTIQELGGTMPEDLPTPGKSVQQIEKSEKKKQIE